MRLIICWDVALHLIIPSFSRFGFARKVPGQFHWKISLLAFSCCTSSTGALFKVHTTALRQRLTRKEICLQCSLTGGCLVSPILWIRLGLAWATVLGNQPKFWCSLILIGILAPNLPARTLLSIWPTAVHVSHLHTETSQGQTGNASNLS